MDDEEIEYPEPDDESFEELVDGEPEEDERREVRSNLYP